MSAALALENVTHSYDQLRALDRVDLTLAKGEVVCLLGPSGCGKTTALRVAAGLERLQQGKVYLDGRVVADQNNELPPEARGIGLVFQDFALFPHLSIFHNVAFGISDQPASAINDRVQRVLEQVGMRAYANAYPHTLSGGQQQRVALARALAPRPKLMLLDEPFSGLDMVLRNQIRDDTLHVLKQSGASTLLVTHDPEEAMFMADRIALMLDGRIVQQGAPADLYNHPKSGFVASFFGDINRLEGIVENESVSTQLGSIAAPHGVEGEAVEVLIRPEALLLVPPGSDPGPRDGLVEVLASRLLGRTSLIHLKATGEGAADLHLHARIAGQFLPAEGEIFEVRLDRKQTFVFPLKNAT